MENRRGTVGRRIKRARLRAGYRSQRAFAAAIGVHEASVAYAESGSERVGDTVFAAIEEGLGWPEDCIMRYLQDGEPLPPPTQSASPTLASFQDDPLPPEVQDAWDTYVRERPYGVEEARDRLYDKLKIIEDAQREQRHQERKRGRSA